MTKEHKPFFYVWRDRGKHPWFKHKTYESAVAEATRLSDKKDGGKFYILMEVGEVCLADDPVWFAKRQRELCKKQKQLQKQEKEAKSK